MSEPQETANGTPGTPGASEAASVVELPKAKRKPGRPKGSTKWPGSGRQKGTINRTTAELRRYIHRNANPVGQVCKIAKGKLTLDGLSQADAVKMLYRAVIPELKADILSGPDDGPIRTEDATRLGMVELGRRAAFLLDLAGRESQTEGAPRSTPTTPFSPPCGPGSASGHTPAPSGQSPEILKSNSPNQSPHKNYGNPDGARSPDSRLGVTAPAADASRLFTSAAAPASTTPAPNEAHEAAPEPDRAPVPGEVADVGDFTIHCHEGTREGLPPTFQIRGDRGQIHAQAVGGWKGALAWVERHSPDGADLSVKITSPRPLGVGSRPDERAARRSELPAVHRGYEHRKRT